MSTGSSNPSAANQNGSNKKTDIAIAIFTLIGAVLGAVITGLSGVASTYLTYLQATKAADRASDERQANICLDSLAAKELALSNHASAFLGGIGAYYNVVTQQSLYVANNQTTITSLGQVSIEGFKSLAYTSPELSEITFKITDVSGRLLAGASTDPNDNPTPSILKKLDVLKRDWQSQYLKDMNKLQSQRKDCLVKAN